MTIRTTITPVKATEPTPAPVQMDNTDGTEKERSPSQVVTAFNDQPTTTMVGQSNVSRSVCSVPSVVRFHGSARAMHEVTQRSWDRVDVIDHIGRATFHRELSACGPSSSWKHSGRERPSSRGGRVEVHSQAAGYRPLAWNELFAAHPRVGYAIRREFLQRTKRRRTRQTSLVANGPGAKPAADKATTDNTDGTDKKREHPKS